VSLILEALRKLEREKRSSEPGFLVLGPTSWPSASRGARGAVIALIAGLALLATALGVLAWRNSGRSEPASRLAAAQPVTPAAPEAPLAAATADILPSPAGLPRPIQVASPPPAPAITTAPMPARIPAPDRAATPPQTADVSEAETSAIAEPPAPSPQAPQPRFRLQAISVRDGKPVAVLNDRMVYEGDSFDGVSVVRIGETEVELEIDGRRVVVGF